MTDKAHTTVGNCSCARCSYSAAKRMARPLSVPCIECGASVAVAPQGYIGSWCTDCKVKRHRAAVKAAAARARVQAE